MNVLLITLIDIRSAQQRDLYSDLMGQFAARGHEVYIVSPAERRFGLPTGLRKDGAIHILKVRTGNIQKTNLIEKGISTVALEYQLRAAVKKHLSHVRFDLVLYSTPPITLTAPVRYLKKRDAARTYLLLKDIFPQNAVDMGMLKKSGIKGLLYRHFRRQEKKLYALSDRIGCMSDANVEYLLGHNPEIDPKRVEVCPNSVAFRDMRVDAATRAAMREKYALPLDRKIFVYGGNLGKPQGIPFLMECLKQLKNHESAYFLIVGDGTEYGRLEAFFQRENPANMQLLKRLPKEDYDRLVAACDVGMVFLDHRFTIPNFPSRLLSYMQAGLPVLCSTDPNTDIGKVCEEGGFGWWCESNDVAPFCALVDRLCAEESLAPYGEKGIVYLQKHYTAEASCDIILKSMQIGSLL